MEAKPTHLIEFETMLYERFRHLANPSARRRGGLDRSAYLLLSRLQAEGPMSIGELSDAFRLDVSTLNRQTAAMLKSDLVERIPDPGGGIARKFRITTEGRDRLEEERAAGVASLDRVLAGWSADDVAAFAGYLRRFNTDIERLAGRPWPRG
ncbi:MarR family winged helix-turn-helix transcriptional regulator [Nonomuraea soli]|uniref:DNA-binding MarR family transcriptional regulator n=1 Tax=Nonomuraea soli TaxID=1032476 RepID=A0A7W0CSR9_9ACTN|nr:MarR family transcriptional regulator [Nonomuraea soli]MBA2896547.1 DNA-binding MarR family transcriptional regulator [Nonomuraea soli]